MACDSIEEFKDELESILGEKNGILKSVIEQLVKLDGLVRSEVEKHDIKIEYSTMSSVYSNFNFHSGLVFSILNASFQSGGHYNRRRAEESMIELAYGGRFDNLIESFKL